MIQFLNYLLWDFDFGEFGLPVCDLDWEELTNFVFCEDSANDQEERDLEYERASKRARKESLWTTAQ